MDNVTAKCPIHDVPMYEKEGQYGPFWSHKTTDENYAGSKGYCNGKPPKGGSYPRMEVREPVAPAPMRDFDKEARGKTRCAIFCAVIAKEGLEAALAQKTKIELGVSFVMTGPSVEDDIENGFE